LGKKAQVGEGGGAGRTLSKAYPRRISSIQKKKGGGKGKEVDFSAPECREWRGTIMKKGESLLLFRTGEKSVHFERTARHGGGERVLGRTLFIFTKGGR